MIRASNIKIMKYGNMKVLKCFALNFQYSQKSFLQRLSRCRLKYL